MANEQNLIPFTERTKSEQRAIASAGGKASGEARRRRRALKEELLILLDDGDTQQRIAAALISEAIEGNSAGSVTKAFEVIRDTIGEKPVDKVMVADVDLEILEAVERDVETAINGGQINDADNGDPIPG